MTVEREAEGAMTELADMLARELKDKGWSYRDAEEPMKVSRSAIGNILNGVKDPNGNIQIPTVETLEKLATYFKLPLWRVIQMAGIDLGLPRSIDESVQQLNSLVKRMPEIEPIVQYLLKLYPDDLRGVVAYLELLDRQHGHDEGWTS